MRYDPDRHHRRSIRLPGWDYAQAGLYYVTLCAQGRLCLFGEVVDGEVQVNDAGWVVERVWRTLADAFPRLANDIFVLMPNHLHGVVGLTGDPEPADPTSPGNRPHGTEPGGLGRIMQTFKGVSTYEYAFGVHHYEWPPFPGRLWQRNYYEHIIRNEAEYERVVRYIEQNPARWEFDGENPNRDRGAEADPLLFEDE